MNCVEAVEFLEKRLHLLEHGDTVVKMVAFTHDSPGVKKLKRQIAEALVNTLERNGFVIEAP